MKQRTFWRDARRYWLFILVLTLSALPVFGQKSQASVDILDLLKRHDEAMNKHDLEGVLALFDPGPKTVVMGTGPGEKYQGLAEIREAYTHFFADFDAGSFTHNCYWKNGGGGGNMAWGTAMCKMADTKDGKKREYELNVSAVVQKNGGKWQFVMFHFSNLTGGSGSGQ